ncbi:MAG: hypothetical protein Q8K70_03635 [Bacteroidota bacterium]|nr:hypothetical protein [Bacteroidota bacterium]
MNLRLLKILLLSVCGFIFTLSYSQPINKVNKPTHFGYYNGNEIYSYIKIDSNELKNGNYTFSSLLNPISFHDTIYLNELNINGSYLKNTKNGIWSYKYNTYTMFDLAIKQASNISFQNKLNGLENEYKISYNKGAFEKNATFNQRKITNGRLSNATQLAEINYLNDTIMGIFSISLDNIDIKGKTDQNGFLDGNLILKYAVDDVPIIEKRKYRNGFLLELEKLNANNQEEIIKLNFAEVNNMLNQIENKEKDLDFKISNQYFGLKFNIGYQQTDKRVSEQLQGNKIIEKYLRIYDSIHNHNTIGENKFSILKFTNRFEYLYPNGALQLSKQLTEENLALNEKVNDFLNKPIIVLRKNNSDSLYQQYQILKHIKSKSDQLKIVFEKINSGYFNFRSINKYYSNGVDGLNTQDSISYEYKNGNYTIPFRFKQLISNSDSLIWQIKTTINALQEIANKTILNLSESLKIYENQEKIDSLDKLISSLESRLNEKYLDLNFYVSSDISKRPFSYKLMNSLNERTLNQLKSKYLNQNLQQDEMIAIGNNLICNYSFLDDNKLYLDKIGETQKIWNDSLFVVYKDNPFDFRKLETRILEGVLNASTILLRHYANQLLNAKNCEQLNLEFEKIKRLNLRIEYLVKNHELNNVQQLNKALRRERVPYRIERLLEL